MNQQRSMYKGNSYYLRVLAVNKIYEQYARIGLSNKEIWKRYVYPVYGISERTFNRYISPAIISLFHDELTPQ